MSRKKQARGMLEVKGYDCSDINPWSWEPENNEVYYWLAIHIGLTGENSSSIYSICVATPEGLVKIKNEQKEQLDRVCKILIVESYSWKAVTTIIENELAKINTLGPMYMEDKLRRIFNWEYEGMK